MRYKDFNMQEHGFVGHMAEPDKETEQAVIVIMDGEKSLIPEIKIAEHFADYGILMSLVHMQKSYVIIWGSLLYRKLRNDYEYRNYCSRGDYILCVVYCLCFCNYRGKFNCAGT